MLIGLIGAPNKGKSTIFSALTMNEVQIADYAFTTIKPNLGVAHVSKECVEIELGVKCRPRNSTCTNGVRKIPVNVVDVAGLVPGAHLGKGMGNQFLNDLAGADALIQVVDCSGETDMHGERVEWADPAEEVIMVRKELVEWVSGIIARHMQQLSRNDDAISGLHMLLSGFKATQEQVRHAISAEYLTSNKINWSADECTKFASRFLEDSKPIVIAANKMDKSDTKKLEWLRSRLRGYEVIECSGAMELAIKKAEAAGLIRYTGGSIHIIGKPTLEQEHGIQIMSEYLQRHNGTGINDILSKVVFQVLHKIVAYPVEDENKFTDHFGNVLPDAVLMDSGSTALQLAERIHTDIAKGMKYGIDAKKKLRIPKDYILKDNDVIKIFSTGAMK
jgi:hypothetical protein